MIMGVLMKGEWKERRGKDRRGMVSGAHGCLL